MSHFGNIKTLNFQFLYVFFEPTDRRKATKIIQSNHIVSYCTPNLSELHAMAKSIESNLSDSSSTIVNNDISKILELAKIVSKSVKNLVITMGSKGVITVQTVEKNGTQNANKSFETKLYNVDVIDNVESVSGAGDCFASGFIYGILSGLSEARSISIAFEAAKLALLCKTSVPHNLKVARELDEAKYKIIRY